MDFVVFYAWQSDRPAKLNRNLIRTAAGEAVRRIANDSQVEESPRLDHDTEGIPGMPAIAETIFAKFEKCDVFLADATFVGATSQGSKVIPNANVLIELGYAAKALGWDRILSVMNTAYGIRDELPFDLRHRRWPIDYHLPEDGSGDLAAVRRDLGAINGVNSLHSNQ